MRSRLQDRQNCKVTFVDSASATRQMTGDILRNALGFANVQGLPSVEEALRYLEVERVDWLILPLAADQDVNAIHVLKLCTEVADLRHIRVSLLVDESEKYAISTAFELGMLSFHAKPFTKDSLTNDFKRFFAAMESVGYDETLTAALGIREWTTLARNYLVRLSLEKGLVETFPGNAAMLLHLAEAWFLSGQRDRAKSMLAQAKLVDPKVAEKVDEMAGRLFGAGAKIDAVSEAGGEMANLLGVKSCVIVDPDDELASATAKMLNELGVVDVQKFGDGEAAMASLTAGNEPELIIMEWRIPKLSGPFLVQRLRSHGFLSVPIVVFSTLIQPDDMLLLKEMSVATVIAKPLNKEVFVPELVMAMQQERAPSDLAAIERKVRRLLSLDQCDEALPLKEKLLADASFPSAKKKLVAAEYAFATGQLKMARDLGVEALKMSGDSHILLNLLGKVFMRLGDHKSALKCFTRAQEISPQNIERLCAIAEAQTEMGAVGEAEDTLESAKALDPDSKVLAEAEVKVAIARGDTEGARKIMSSLDSLSSLISYMNNKAVAQARNGMTKEATELYQKTIDSIPDDRPEVRAVVLYNLTLALVRQGDLELARHAARNVIEHEGANERILKKAKSLEKRLAEAIAKGTPFQLFDDASRKKADGGADGDDRSWEDGLALAANVDVARGDICCFMIFHNPDPVETRAASLLASPPRFASRSAIARRESGGDMKGKRRAS